MLPGMTRKLCMAIWQSLSSPLPGGERGRELAGDSECECPLPLGCYIHRRTWSLIARLLEYDYTATADRVHLRRTVQLILRHRGGSTQEGWRRFPPCGWSKQQECGHLGSDLLAMARHCKPPPTGIPDGHPPIMRLASFPYSIPHEASDAFLRWLARIFNI